MGAKKTDSTKIPKDWFTRVDTPSARRQLQATLEKKLVTSLEEITKLTTPSEAAVVLRSNIKTVHDWMAKKYLKSVKIRGRRYTTAQWIQDFIEREAEKND